MPLPLTPQLKPGVQVVQVHRAPPSLSIHFPLFRYQAPPLFVLEPLQHLPPPVDQATRGTRAQVQTASRLTRPLPQLIRLLPPTLTHVPTPQPKQLPLMRFQQLPLPITLDQPNSLVAEHPLALPLPEAILIAGAEDLEPMQAHPLQQWELIPLR